MDTPTESPESFDDREPDAAQPDGAAERAWKEVMSRSGIPPRFQAAHLGSNCQRFAGEAGKAAALRLASELGRSGEMQQRGRTRFCLLLSGDFGGGKTWLATASFKELLWARHRSAGAGLWRKFHQFVRHVQGAYSPAATTSVDQVLSLYQKAPVLLLDDVGDLEVPVETDDRRRLLYEVIDYRNDHLLPTLVTTNLDENQLARQFGERTFQRLVEMCAMAGMAGKNLRMED